MILFDTETWQQIGDHQLPGETPGRSPSTPEATSLAIPTSEPRSSTGRASLQIVDDDHSAGAQLRLARPPSGCPRIARTSPPPSMPRTGEAWWSAIRPGISTTRCRCSCGVSTPAPARRSGPAVRVAPQVLQDPADLDRGRAPARLDRDRGPGDATYAIDGETLRVLDRYPVSGFQHRHQPRRAHARVRAGADGRASPARPRLRAGADARLRPRRDIGVGAFSPDGRTAVDMGRRRERELVGPEIRER